VDDDAPNHGEHDDGLDAMAALDFSVPDEVDEFGLAALDDYAEQGDATDVAFAVSEPEPFDGDVDGTEDDVPVPVFTVTNPPGTVTVSAFLDGRIEHVGFDPKVTRLTESQLAEEVVVIARLATQDARSAQYSFMLEGMRQQGHDDAATRDFLSRDLDLPSPEEADTTRASIFSTRYAGEHD
jgi:hypothetical protein